MDRVSRKQLSISDSCVSIAELRLGFGESGFQAQTLQGLSLQPSENLMICITKQPSSFSSTLSPGCRKQRLQVTLTNNYYYNSDFSSVSFVEGTTASLKTAKLEGVSSRTGK